MTPKKPWSFFLNFFWSKICIAKTLSSLARLERNQPQLLNVDTNVDLHVKGLVPIRVQRLLDHLGSFRLLSPNGRHGERVWKACVMSVAEALSVSEQHTKDISLVQAISGNDWVGLAGRSKASEGRLRTGHSQIWLPAQQQSVFGCDTQFMVLTQADCCLTFLAWRADSPRVRQVLRYPSKS